MPTIRLYEENSHLTEHDARVLSCERRPDGFAVIPDRCCLFPTAGGQPHDTGTIGGVPVKDVREEGDALVLITEEPVPVGKDIRVALDWPRRFDFMQQHTGEHLFSYVLFRDLGLNNVGFHLADAYATIDTDRAVSREELAQAVLTTNSMITRDLAVTARSFESEESLAASGLTLRKHAKGLIPPIRVVSIENADTCTCCAPHCARTGEIGCLLVTDCIPWKGGTRITFVCGQRAVRAAAADHDALDTVARSFSAKREDVPDAVARLRDDLSAARASVRALGERLNVYLSKDLTEEGVSAGGNLLCVRALEGLDAKQLSSLGAMLAERPKTLAVLFSRGNDRTDYLITTGAGFPIDAGEIAGIVNMMTGGKGGGRSARAQGSIPRVIPPETAEQLLSYLVSRLGKKS